MPKKRNAANRGLPARWRYLHGAYYFRVPPGQERAWDNKKLFRLGKALPESYKIWADRLGSIEKIKTIGQLLDRYALEVVPTKAPATQKGNSRQIGKLRAAFWDAPLAYIKPVDIYRYFDKRSAKVDARREIALLSHAFTKAVEWGYINRHPFKGEVRFKSEKSRTRYIEDWEVIECLNLSTVKERGGVGMIQAYIRLKLLIGLRRGDLLRLGEDNLREDGIHVTTNKTGRAVIYEWVDELRAAVELAKEARTSHRSSFLFCNRYGEGYINELTGSVSGWDSMWQRFMKRVLAETKITESFTEHDLRAKVASDAGSLEQARALLAHSDSKLTNRVYRRKPEVVKLGQKEQKNS